MSTATFTPSNAGIAAGDVFPDILDVAQVAATPRAALKVARTDGMTSRSAQIVSAGADWDTLAASSLTADIIAWLRADVAKVASGRAAKLYGMRGATTNMACPLAVGPLLETSTEGADVLDFYNGGDAGMASARLETADIAAAYSAVAGMSAIGAFRLDGVPAAANVVTQMTLNFGATNVEHAVLGVNAAGRLFGRSKRVNSDAYATATAADALGAGWHFAALTVNGSSGEMKLVLDGVEVASATLATTGTLSATSGVRYTLGGDRSNLSGQANWKGRAWSALYFKKALSMAELKVVMGMMRRGLPDLPAVPE